MRRCAPVRPAVSALPYWLHDPGKDTLFLRPSGLLCKRGILRAPPAWEAERVISQRVQVLQTLRSAEWELFGGSSLQCNLYLGRPLTVFPWPRLRLSLPSRNKALFSSSTSVKPGDKEPHVFLKVEPTNAVFLYWQSKSPLILSRGGPPQSSLADSNRHRLQNQRDQFELTLLQTFPHPPIFKNCMSDRVTTSHMWLFEWDWRIQCLCHMSCTDTQL